MNRAEYGEGLRLLTGAIGKSMPAEQVAAWFAVLRELTAEQFKRGIVETLRTHQYAGFPPVGTVRSNALTGVAGSIASKDRPLAAWQDVREAIGKVGTYLSPCFDDPVIHAVIRGLGGWPKVCDTLASDMKWLQKEFCATYSALSNVKLSEDQTRRLHGLYEISNAREGHKSEPVKVAHIRCLTGSSNAEHFITLKEELPTQSVSDVAKLGDASTEALSLAISIDEPDEFDASDQEANTSDPPKSKPEQIAELKRVANHSDSQSKAG